jgi:plastocyanin
VHALAVQLAPVLAAEKSKTAFYIAGGVLVAWALILSLGLGLRRPDFPFSLTGQRIVGTISAVLVLAAVSTAVLTSGGATSSAGAQSAAAQATPSTAAAPAPTTESTPAVTATGTISPKATTKSTPPATKSTPAAKAKTSPKATTGTPAPPSSPAAATTTLKLAANPAGQLSYDVKQLSAKAGTVTIDMANMSPVEHNVTIAEGGKVLGATPTFTGGTKTLTVKLKPGTYTFFCSVPGHRQAGMEGTLTVS